MNDRRILIDWGNVGDDDDRTTVEWRFTPRVDGTTFVEITEAGYGGDADQVVTRALGSMGAFTMVLSAVKALLEHDIVLTSSRIGSQKISKLRETLAEPRRHPLIRWPRSIDRSSPYSY